MSFSVRILSRGPDAMSCILGNVVNRGIAALARSAKTPTAVTIWEGLFGELSLLRTPNPLSCMSAELSIPGGYSNVAFARA